MRFLSACCLIGAAVVVARSAPEPAPQPHAPGATKYVIRESDKLTNTDPVEAQLTSNRQKSYDLKVTAGRKYVATVTAGTINSQPILRIENQTGRVVAGAAAGGARIEFTPGADATYRVIVTTSYTALGSFALRVWEAGETVVEKDDTLTPDDPLDRGPTGSPSRRYEEKVPAGEVRVVRLTSNTFDPHVRVENERGTEIASERGRKGGTAAQVFLNPAKDGAHALVVKSSGYPLTGAFALSVLRPADKDDIASFDKTDAIGPTDPFDRVLSRNRRKVYEEKLDAGAAYVYELASAAFQPHLRVETADGAVLAEDADPRLVRLPVVPAAGGNHRIVVTTRRADAVGAFALRRFVTDGRAEGVRGADKIGAGDPFHREPTDKYVRSTKLKLTAGTRYVVDVTSDAFTPALHLEGPDGKFVAGAEGGVGAAGAQLSFAPPATGEYMLHVTSTADGRDGAFQRRVYSGAAAPKDGLRQEDTLTAKDPLDSVTTGRRHKSFPVKLTYGRLYEVAVDSEAIDSFVYLTDANGRVVAEDDNGGTGTNSLLRFTPPRSDTYTVVVTSATPNEVGKFAVKVTEPLVKAVKVEPVLNSNGELTTKDPVFAVPTQSRAKVVTHKLEAGKAYLIRLDSADFAPYLRVEDETGKSLAQAGATGRSAALLFECPRAGTYRFVATTTRANASGAFVLSADVLAPGESVTDRLDSGTRFRAPTEVQQKDVTLSLRGGTRYLVQVDGLRGATLAVQPADADPVLVRASSVSAVDFTPPTDGQYRVIVFARETGPFSVRARPLVAEPELSSKLDVTDPGDVLTTDRRCKTFTHRLSAGRLYLLRTESADFEPLARVLDRSGVEVGRAGAQGGRTAQATFTAPADGEYTVITTSAATGRFRTRLDPLVSVTEKKEELVAADPFDALPATDGRTQKVYEQRLEAKSFQTFRLTSSAFDTTMRLTDAQGKQVAFEQTIYPTEKGGRMGAEISFQTTAAGVYRLGVTSRYANGAGAFKLQTRRYTPVLSKDESLATTDPFDRAPSGRFYKRYKAKLEAGVPYTVEMTSEKYSQMVRIEDETGKESGRFAPDYGEGGKPMRRLFIPDKGGEFTFFATTQYPGGAGPFTFSVSTSAITRQIDGRLTANDNFDPLNNESYQAVHTIDLKAGRLYVIGLESADFAPAVRIESERGKHLVRYSPSRKGATYITYAPTKDERVRAVVTTNDSGKTGAYRLTVRE